MAKYPITEDRPSRSVAYQPRCSRMLSFSSMSIFRNNLLKGKTAFVTGGGSGIGQRMAERFAGHGAHVILAGRKQEKLDAAASAICKAGGTVSTATLDVRDYLAVEDALKRTHDQFGEIDVLVA